MLQRFQKVVACGRTGYAVLDFPSDVLLQLVEQPQAALAEASTKLIKTGNSALVARVELPMHDVPVTVAYKRVRRKTLLKQLTQAAGNNRTLRAFIAGHRLLDLGIATARPLAVVVPSRFDLKAPTWIVSEWIDGETLAAVAKRSIDNAADARDEWKASAISVGILLGQLHAAGVSHRDLKSQNLMRHRAANGNIVASVIDLDGIAFVGSLSASRRWKDLARLARDAMQWRDLSLSTRLRFLIAYAEAAGLPTGHETAWRQIATTLPAQRTLRRVA